MFTYLEIEWQRSRERGRDTERVRGRGKERESSMHWVISQMSIIARTVSDKSQEELGTSYISR